MNKKVKYLLIFVTLISLLFLSCQIGLGKEVDLEAPTITLTKMQSGTVELPSAKFGGGIYCGKKVSFFGTATDNEGVDSVYAEIKWSNETEYKHFADATLTGETFRFDLIFEQNGTAYIKFVATDKAKNYNVNSSKVVTLLVDDQAPVGEGWYIDRHINGITYPLKDIEELKKVDFNSQDNKDVAQNVEFSICSAFNDEMGIKPGSISIQIKNEKNELICTIPNSSTNDYSPVFKITHDTLVTANAELATGRHFLQIWYNAEDIVELPDSNKAQDVQVPCGWFVWEPESDNPKITQSPLPAENTNEVLVNVKDTVYATLFDDDGLKDVSCALLKKDEYNPTTDNQNLVTNIQEIFNRVPELERSSRVKKYIPSSTERDVRLSFTAPDSPQGMYLVCYVKDVYEKTTTKIQLITVTDASAPILHIASPANNSIPEVTMSNDSKSATVTIEGQTLDTSGCTYLEFLWVSNSFDKDNNKKAEKANAVFNTITSSKYAPQSEDNAKQSSLEDGIKLWSVKLGPEITAGNGYKKQSFNFNMDLLNDFDSEKNEEKFFVVRVTRKDGKQTIQQYKLSADNLPPVIKSFKPEAKTQIVESNEDYVLEFKAEKTNGVAIDTSKYKIYQNENGTKTPLQGEFDSSTGTYKYTIFKTILENWEIKTEKPVFIFEAADIFENSVSSQYTLIINNLPQLKSITSSAPQNCKLGQEIQINANFSSAITLTDDDLKGSYILLTNIKNGSLEKECKAVYKSGAGSQTIIFEYTPVEGDYTDTDINVGVKYEYDTETTCANNLIQNCAKLKDGENVHLNTLLSSNVLNGKQIKVDAVSPKVDKISISEGKKAFKAGETVTATATFTKSILVQGSPTLILKVGSEDFELNLERSTSDEITFKGTVTTGLNGNISYSDKCITGAQYITDNYQNVLITDDTQLTESDYVIDTTNPKTPSVTISNSNSQNKYKSSVSFTIVKNSADSDIAKYEYSTNSGVSWTDLGTTETASITSVGSHNLCARVTDHAGNVSPVSTPIALEIEKSFPNYNVECMTSDGYYSAGKTITFRVTFDKKINITDKYSDITFDGKTAKIVFSEENDVSYAEFEYTVESTDDFNLGSKSLTVDLSGIQDSFGFTGGTSTATINRQNVVCDGVAPTIVSANPNDGTKLNPNYTADAKNIYTTGNQIKITFSEPVQKGSGNIILRQTSGWALPPVLTAEEYNTICAQLGYDDKNKLARQEVSGKLEEDMEDTAVGIQHRNNEYHGTGQYIGPYKKSMQGIKLEKGNYVPDIDTKFVLDFDIGIWETTEPHPIGETFENHAYKAPTSTTSAGEIRGVLEKAGLHQRVLDVTSANVKIDENDKSSVIITFPAGLIDKTDALPDGREWELVFEKGTFLDITGNEFGAGLTKDAIQENGTQTEVSNTWKRGRTSITDGSKPLVLIKTNGNEYFNSDKVATPVVRVDRYSYGLGIRQANKDGTLTVPIAYDGVKPTGYVRVRIDCETKDATVVYSETKVEKENNSAKSENTTYSNAGATSYYTTTDVKSYTPPVSSYTTNSIFAVGSGDYKKSYKGIIAAKGTKTSFTSSDDGIEGVFQTVVYFSNPITGTDTKTSCSSLGSGKTDISIRGTTGFAGEPYISPFPLRDSRVGSPYLRIVFREKSAKINTNDYYWVSYEVLVESSFSNYCHGKNDGDVNYYDWARNWGIMNAGEFTRVDGMQGWRN